MPGLSSLIPCTTLESTLSNKSEALIWRSEFSLCSMSCFAIWRWNELQAPIKLQCPAAPRPHPMSLFLVGCRHSGIFRPSALQLSPELNVCLAGFEARKNQLVSSISDPTVALGVSLQRIRVSEINAIRNTLF